MCLDNLVKLAQIVSYLVAAFAALRAVLVYRDNARRERAHWADTLFSRFFVALDYRKVRDLLDSDPDDPEVVKLVENDRADWTDYLNFFEFVFYLQVTKQLFKEDVDALFGYYVGCLKKHPAVINYIKDKGKSFEYLRRQIVGE
jgi:hypothetical protein